MGVLGNTTVERSPVSEGPSRTIPENASRSTLAPLKLDSGVVNVMCEVKRQSEFAASAIDFSDMATAKQCLRDALRLLGDSPRSSATGELPPEAQATAGNSENLPHRARINARRRAERAADGTEEGDHLSTSTHLREALSALEDR